MYKVGQKVKINSSFVFPVGDAGSPEKEHDGVYTVVHNDPAHGGAIVCFHCVWRGWGFNEEGNDNLIPEKYRGKNWAFAWVLYDQMEKFGVTDRMKNSGKKMGKAAIHGFKVAAAQEGAEYAYNMACTYLHNQFNIPMERLQDETNREVVMAMGLAALHMMSSVAEGVLPGMEHIQNGCELVIEGKAKDHGAILIKTAAPMLMHISNLMNPEKALERLSKQVEDGLKETGLTEEQSRINLEAPTESQGDSEAEAEAEAEITDEENEQHLKIA